MQRRDAATLSTIDSAAHTTALSEEQEKLDEAFAGRDRILAYVDAQLATQTRDATQMARMQLLRRQRAELQNADHGLIFGRLDAHDRTVRHLGRVGIPGATDDDDPLVIDWRAPAARAFYTATPVDPQGQARRRHVRTLGREVVGVDDEPLDGSAETELVGEGALLAALGERRTGQMGSAAATLQREQDDVVRADARGPLIVQGGPGTGKTVVALHRVAYLLFTYPQLAAQGVLVIGPSPRFLDYIAQVLPALGETAVVSSTVDSLVPGIEVERAESRAIAELKGRASWQQSLMNYVAARVPHAEDLELLWEGESVVLPASSIARALAASTSGRSYHAARTAFAERIHELLADAVVEHSEALLAQAEEGFEDILGKIDAGLARSDDRALPDGARGSEIDGTFSDEDVERLRERISTDRALTQLLDEWWPTLEVESELRRLLTSRELLHLWMPSLSDSDVNLIVGEPTGWAPSDVPLLDALYDLIGSLDARGEQGEFLAERAAAQRDWVYGHVVIDEAQELTEMHWQMVLRRCPSRSITAVGDIDQTEAPHQHTTWEHAVGAALATRWTEARLTICYRTPSEVMALTGPVLARAGSRNEPPRAVRSVGIEPWERTVSADDLPASATAAVTTLAASWSGGTVGVVAPVSRVSDLRKAMPDVPVLTAAEAKGLEWDATLLIDPAGIAAEPRGWNGLYVALTRCTQELGQLHVNA
ncbi:HelD family protein [Paramicrobacterium chengjingii]|uniref:HelD family protein n=1 Tax=Paramicrobacterium chengjingii TaxID=2769067 RepID=UPI001422BE3B|nr:AAA family ATPase [Microbacterium chengjingii]